MTKKLLLINLLLIPILIYSYIYSLNNEEQAIISINSIQDKKIYINVKKNNKILKVELEEYIIGVVAGEMPALFNIEALKAQAVASRTYVISKINNSNIIESTTDDQVYLTKEEMQTKWQENYQEYYDKIASSVKNTKNQIMYYNNIPIKAYYYSSSNGYTESSLNVFKEDNAYLKIVSSPFEEVTPVTTTISLSTFCQKLSISCNELKIENTIKDSSNRIQSITINNQEFTGIEVRKKLSLRSTDFEIKKENNNILISTKGYGHGVGMSQYGANAMATLGYNYKEILKYYYQNIEISSI